MNELLLNAAPCPAKGESVQTVSGPRKIRRPTTTPRKQPNKINIAAPKKRLATPSDRAFDNLYFDGRHFWHPHPTMGWERLNIHRVTRVLRVDYGLSGARPEGHASQIDFVLWRVQQEHPIVGKPRLIQKVGRRLE